MLTTGMLQVNRLGRSLVYRNIQHDYAGLNMEIRYGNGEPQDITKIFTFKPTFC